MDIMDTTNMDLRACKTCGVSKSLDCFEMTTKTSRRKECKPCYASKKKERAKVAAQGHDRDTTPKPEACAKCARGYPEVDFKWRSDVKQGGWRSECNACYNAKGYCEEYRKREREKDEEGYLARNAASHLAWAHKNPDKVKEQQVITATEPGRRIKQIKTSAVQRGIAFAEEDTVVMSAKLSCPCHFCKFIPAPGEPLNGLDRVDASQGYTDANTVPCCPTCNAMKCVMHADEFVTNIRAIVAHCRIEPCTDGDRCRLRPFAGTADRREAEAMDKDTRALDEELKIKLWSSPCYLCGRGPSFGIDRVDSSKGYVPNNVQPCCSTYCNYMKKDLDLGDFKRHVAYVYGHTKEWVLGDITDVPLTTNSGQERSIVAAVDANGADIMLFPSMDKAASIAGVTSQAILQALDDPGSSCVGHAWKRSTPRAFKMQHAMADAAAQLFIELRRARQIKTNGGCKV